MHNNAVKIILQGGQELEVKEVAGGGYIASPMGARFLGGAPSRNLVGKYVLSVVYSDGDDGLVPQEEVQEIRDDEGKPVPFGNEKFPGHPNYDPRAEGAVTDHIQYMLQKLKSMRKPGELS